MQTWVAELHAGLQVTTQLPPLQAKPDAQSEFAAQELLQASAEQTRFPEQVFAAGATQLPFEQVLAAMDAVELLHVAGAHVFVG
jgi:hypothetical protein